MQVNSHSNFWKKIGERLLRDYESFHKSTYLDSASKGKKGEGYFRKWLSLWLPNRVEVLEGVIVDKDTNPTTQRDVIIFDRYNCPIFKETDDEGEELNILPIEGVIGAIEVNTSEVKTKKIIKDIDKLVDAKKLMPLLEPPKAMCLKPPPEPELVNYYSIVLQKFGYIFAQDCDISLRTLSEHIRDKNIELGVDVSVDGIFILKKGCILHGISQGWTTTRLSIANLFYMEMESWDVLLTLVCMINQHLALGAKGNIPDLEKYFQSREVNRKDNMLKNRMLVDSDGKYTKQESKFLMKL